MTFSGVIFLNVAKVWAGSFVVPVFFAFLNARVW